MLIFNNDIFGKSSFICRKTKINHILFEKLNDSYSFKVFVGNGRDISVFKYYHVNLTTQSVNAHNDCRLAIKLLSSNDIVNVDFALKSYNFIRYYSGVDFHFASGLLDSDIKLDSVCNVEYSLNDGIPVVTFSCVYEYHTRQQYRVKVTFKAGKDSIAHQVSQLLSLQLYPHVDLDSRVIDSVVSELL